MTPCSVGLTRQSASVTDLSVADSSVRTDQTHTSVSVSYTWRQLLLSMLHKMRYELCMITRHLINFANNADLPEPEDDVPNLPIPGPVATQWCSWRLAWTCIELKDVFDFTSSASGLDFYWKGGELKLEKESEAVERDHYDKLVLDVGHAFG